MVKIEEVKRDRKKSVIMSIRTTEEISKFMKKHDISPSLVFHKAVGEMMDGGIKLTDAGKAERL